MIKLFSHHQNMSGAAIFKMDNQQVPNELHREIYSMLYSHGWEGSLGGMDTRIYMTESLCCPPETTGYTPYKIKF